MVKYLRFVCSIILVVLLPFTSICQTPAVPQWVSDIGGSGSTAISLTTTDSQNNIYVTGIFSGTVDFDPSAGVKNLTSVGNSVDAFVAKYTTNGTLVWAVSIGGTGTDQPNCIAIDNAGNLAISGQYDSPILDANPDGGTFNLTNSGALDMFVLNLDNNGNFLWAKSIGGAGIDYGNNITVDAAGNRILGGQFQNTINVGGTSITANGSVDGLIAKYDAAGNLLWTVHLGQTSDNGVRGVLADTNGDIIVAGAFNGNINFNPLGTPYNLTANTDSYYIAKYSATGQLIWLRPITGSIVGYTTNLAIDPADNNIYLDGRFSSPLSFSNTTLNPSGTQDLFLARYDANGTQKWVKDIGGSGASIFNNGIAVKNNAIYLSGFFNGTVDFDPSASVSQVQYHGQRDLFLAKYDTNGGYQWAFGAGNSSCNNTLARSVNVDNNNDIILGGVFCSTVNFDASNCTAYNVTAQSNIRDSFLAKYVPGFGGLSNNVIKTPAVFSFCANGDPAVITGTTPTGGNNIYTYQWQVSTDNINFINITSATAKDYDPGVINTTTYYRRITASGTCLATLSNVVSITVSNNGTLTNNVITPPATTSFCAGGDPDLIIGSTPSGGSGFSYQWQSSIDNITFSDIPGATAKDYDPSVITATTYYRRIVNNGTCSVPLISNVVMLTVTSAPVGSVSADVTICQGTTTILNASGGTNYQWLPAAGLSNPNISNPIASPLVTTTYTVTITNGTGCSTTASVTVTVIEPPIVDAGTDKTIVTGQKVQLAATVTGNNLQYSWSPKTDLDNPAILNPIASPKTTITYTLTVTSALGCFVVNNDVTIKVAANLVPSNTFSPNGDGINDLWAVNGLSTYPNCMVSIYNRYGVPIYTSKGYVKAWDGKYKNQPVPSGTYYYTIDLKDGSKVISGWLVVIK